MLFALYLVIVCTGAPTLAVPTSYTFRTADECREFALDALAARRQQAGPGCSVLRLECRQGKAV